MPAKKRPSAPPPPKAPPAAKAPPPTKAKSPAKKRAKTAPSPKALAKAESIVVVQAGLPSLHARTQRFVRLDKKQCAVYADKEWAQAEAGRKEHGDTLRLIGTAELLLSTPRPCECYLVRKVAPTRAAAKKWGKDSLVEWWDASTGQICNMPSISLAALVQDGAAPDDTKDIELLHALVSLATPDHSLWATPLLCTLASLRPAPGQEEDGGLDDGPDDKGAQKSYRHSLHLAVYASRLYFETNGGELSRAIFGRLSPACAPVRALSSLPPPPAGPVFCTTGGADAPPFSLEALLKAAEDSGYREARQPQGLALRMLPYQLQTLAWMQDMESPRWLPAGVNGLIWEEHAFADGGSYFYSPQLGESRLDRPPVVWGGMLCEEMGLGKSLEVTALVQSTRGHGPTLIVAPEELLGQWENEIAKSTTADARLSVCTLSSPPPQPAHAQHAAAKPKWTAEQLQAADVVLASYAELEQAVGSSVLPAVRWYRVCLDEMQHVRVATSKLAKAAEGLTAERRWLVSGTPLYTGIDDLKGELNFLRVSPFGAEHEDGFWRWCVGDPWARRDEAVLRTLAVLFESLVMRHSKSQLVLRTGRPLLELPAQTVRYVAVPLGGSELAVYEFAEEVIASLVRGRLESGALTAPADGATNANAMSRVAAKSAATMDHGLRLLRELTGTSLVLTGGAGVHPQLRLLHELETLRVRERGFNFSAPLGSGANGPLEGIRKLEPMAAIQQLTQGQDANESLAHRRMAGGMGMVRYGGEATSGVHERARVARAAPTDFGAELRKSAMRRLQLTDRLEELTRAASRMRWRWSLERLTCAPNCRKLWLDCERLDAAELQQGGALTSRFWWRVWRLRARLLRGLLAAQAQAEAEWEMGRFAGDERHGLFGGGHFALEDTLQAASGAAAAAAAEAEARLARCPAANVAEKRRLETAAKAAAAKAAASAAAESAAQKAVEANGRVAMAAGRGRLQGRRGKQSVGASASGSESQSNDEDDEEEEEEARELSLGGDALDSRLRRAKLPPGVRPNIRLELLLPRWGPHGGSSRAAAAGGAGAAGSARASASESDTADAGPAQATTTAASAAAAAAAAQSGRGTGAHKLHLLAPSGWRPPSTRRAAATFNAQAAASPYEHVCNDACVRTHTQEHAAEVLSRAHTAAREAAQFRLDIGALRAFEAKLQRSEANQLELTHVEQRGFSELLALSRGEEVSATCPICFDAVGSCGPPVLIQGCAHFTCKGCMAAHVAHTRAMRTHTLLVADRGNHADATCSLCRRAFVVQELIEILPPAPPTAPSEPPAEGAAAASASAGAGPSSAGLASLASAPPIDNAPKFSPAATREKYLSRSPPSDVAGAALSLPSLPLFDAPFLRHLLAAAGVPPLTTATQPQPAASRSAKVRALLRDLLPLVAAQEKVVVFSAHKVVIEHVALVLRDEGVGFRKVCAAAGKREAQGRAVAEWAVEPGIPVFLLHAGVAAAGLTLVAAHHIFLLDVFAHEAEELQALNRCHRIGQTSEVSCTVYYCPETVEERLLAYRTIESDNPRGSDMENRIDATDALSVLGDTSRQTGQRARQNKIAFLLGVAATERHEGGEPSAEAARPE